MPIVYQTTNNLTNKIYIGYHNGADDSYLGSGDALAHAIKKYGRENFTRKTILTGTKEECLELEEFIVDEEFVLSESNYNLTVGGGLPPVNFGNQYAKGMTYTHSDWAKGQISKAQRGRKNTEETKQLMSATRSGKGKGKRNAMSNPIHRETHRLAMVEMWKRRKS